MATLRQLGTASILAMIAIFAMTVFQLNGAFVGFSRGPVGAATQLPAQTNKLQALASVLEEGCTDPDNQNPMTNSGVTATSVAYSGTLTVQDQCMDAKTVKEAYCVTGKISYTTLTCPGNTQCLNGACV